MRTTLNLDADIHRAVKSLARERGESLGTVASALIRRALRPRRATTATGPVSRVSGFPVVDVPEGAPPVTPEMVADALDETRDAL